MFQVEAGLRALCRRVQPPNFQLQKTSQQPRTKSRNGESSGKPTPVLSLLSLDSECQIPATAHGSPTSKLKFRALSAARVSVRCTPSCPFFSVAQPRCGKLFGVPAWSMVASWSGRAFSCMAEYQVSNILCLQSWSLLEGSSACAQIARYPRIRAPRLRLPESGWMWLLHHALISAERASSAYPCLQPRAHRMHFILPIFESPRRSRLGSSLQHADAVGSASRLHLQPSHLVRRQRGCRQRFRACIRSMRLALSSLVSQCLQYNGQRSGTVDDTLARTSWPCGERRSNEISA